LFSQGRHIASVKALRRDRAAAVERACLAKVLVRVVVWVMGISITVRLEVEGSGAGYMKTVEVAGTGTVIVDVSGGATVIVET
jgi:hypothetical protein